LRKYHSLKDCSVIGIPDPEWGEKIAVALIADEKLNLDELNTWIRTILPGYKIPRLYKIVDDLPRNAMGKVTKNELKNLFI
jgi:malonyl-CoA/methylmalonyl-CoA synthetase